MQENTNWYWKQQSLQHNIIFPTHTIIRPRLYVVGITDVQDISKNNCYSIHAKNSIQKHRICLTDTDYDYILD